LRWRSVLPRRCQSTAVCPSGRRRLRPRRELRQRQQRLPGGCLRPAHHRVPGFHRHL
jgi:hypothetical protein